MSLKKYVEELVETIRGEKETDKNLLESQERLISHYRLYVKKLEEYSDTQGAMIKLLEKELEDERRKK